MDQPHLKEVLLRMGCPPEKAAEMAEHLDRRARQLAESQNRTYEEALAHLVSLMRKGWSAQERGL
jgi:hypothetical protein